MILFSRLRHRELSRLFPMSNEPVIPLRYIGLEMSAELAAPARMASVTVDGVSDSIYFAFLFWWESMSPMFFGSCCTVKVLSPSWGSRCCGPRVTSPNAL